MKIKPSEKAKSYLRMQGVPDGLLRDFSINIEEVLEPAEAMVGDKKVFIPEAKQIVAFNKLCKEPQHKPLILVINSQHYYLQARQLATVLFWSYMQDCLNRSAEFDNQLPLWVFATNEFKNPLFDAREAGKMRHPLMIVVDSLYSDAPTNKLDKVHDWLTTFCDRPILLLMHAENPFNFCVEKLGCRPNIIINLAKSERKKVNVL